MKLSQYTEEQIASTLKQAELGAGDRGLPEAGNRGADFLPMEE